MQPTSSVDVQGRRTCVIVKGDAHMPLVFLHAIGHSLEDWEPRFPPIAARATGSSLSTYLVTGSLIGSKPSRHGGERLARSVVETVDAIGETRRRQVFDHSLGSTVATQLLALNPDRIAELVLSNSAGCSSEVHPMLRLTATPFICRRGMRPHPPDETPRCSAVAAPCTRSRLSKRAPLPAEEVAEEFAQINPWLPSIARDGIGIPSTVDKPGRLCA